MTHADDPVDSVQILYEDDDLLLVNKPPGMLSVPDGYNPALPHLRSILTPNFGDLWMVHRLDKDTSGVIILAKNPQTHRQLNESFRSGMVKKIYHGLVTPAPGWQELTIDFPLAINADRKHRTRVNVENGKTALSLCKVIKRFPLGALLEIEIETGITHQIRAHLRAIDLMLIGDPLYSAGLPLPPIDADRTMLHARTISFSHPTTGETKDFTAPYFDDFRDTYAKLRFTTSLDEVL